MADQGLWFKLWCSALDDPDLDNLELSDFARWVKLGALVKRHGTAGSLTLSPPARSMCAMFHVPDFDALMLVMTLLPHVHVRRENGAVSSETIATVSFHNWAKYQGDFSTRRVIKFRAMKRSRGEEKRRDEMRGDEKRSTSPVVPSDGGDFDRFWASYPKRVGKHAARRAWQTHARTTPLETILTALAAQAEWLGREGGKFIPNPATWLNQRRWEDAPPTPPRPGDDRTRRNIGGVMAWLERQGDVAHDPH
jgi:hypothetical protein